MTSRESYWHNFRLMRERTKDMTPGKRRTLFEAMRDGPLMLGLYGLLASGLLEIPGLRDLERLP